MRRRRKLRFRDAATPYVQIFTEPMRLANSGKCVDAAKSIIRKAALVPLESSRHAQEAYQAASNHVLAKCPKSSFVRARASMNIHASRTEREMFTPLTSSASTWTPDKIVKELKRRERVLVDPTDAEEMLKTYRHSREVAGGKKAVSVRVKSRGKTYELKVRKRGDKLEIRADKPKGRGHANAGKKRNRKKG